MRTEDEYIIYKCLNGESEAFGFLVDKYKESVYAFAFSKLRNFHDAEDVTQEVFIKAFRKLHTLRSWDSFLAWLYTITSNLCKNWIRECSRRPDRKFIDDEKPVALENRSLDSYRERLTYESLHEALDSLPEIYQQVLVLHYLGGMNSFEIARFLGMAPGSIRERLSRARALLKEEMLTMINATFEQQKLKAGFTFHIIETIRGIRAQPISIAKGLPWGISLMTGVFIAFLSIGTHLSIINPTGTMSGSPLPSESKVLKVGEIPVDVMKVSNISVLSNQRLSGAGLGSVVPSLQNALFMAPQAGDTWTKKADMPTARMSLSVNEVNGKIYAIGGADGNGIWFSTVEEYDPMTDRWEKKSNKPTSNISIACVINNQIYNLAPWEEIIEKYDPAIDKWITLRNVDMGDIFSFSASSINDKIYVIGGTKEGIKPLSTVYEYDPIKNTCVKKADMPTSRFMLSTCVADGKIYAIGGWNGNAPPLSNVEEYDPIADKWTKKTNIPEIRHSLVTCTVKGKIYAIGGLGMDGPGPSLVEEYDPIMDTWTRKADMPTGRWHSAGCVVNEKIYVVGGVNRMEGVPSLSTLEVYDPGTSGESINFKGKLPTTWGDVKLARNK